MSTLSDRFDALPEPEYNNLPVQANSAEANGLKRHTANNNNNTVLYQQAAAAQPQIIRPNVSNLSIAPYVAAANKASAIQLIPVVMNSSNNTNNGMNRNANKVAKFVAKRNPNTMMTMNGNQQSRGRGFKNNYVGNGHPQQRRQAAPQQPQQQLSGYRAYRTSTAPRQPFNHSPYKRPPTVQQRVRELPAYANHVFDRNHNQQQSQNHNHNYNNNNNSNHNNYRNNAGFRTRGNTNGFVPRQHGNFRQSNRAFNQNQGQFNHTHNHNNNNNNNNNSRFNNHSNGNSNNNNNNNANRRGKFTQNTNRGNNGNGGANFAFNKKGNLSEASLDRELNAYLMKNPDAEARTNSINSNLDKELDDYWKTGGQTESAQEDTGESQPSAASK